MDLSNYAQEILNLVNIHRANAGVQNLSLSATLTEGATVRANEIISYFSHTRPDGTACTTVVENTYPSGYLGENIAAGQQSAEEVVDAWMNSPGHRENILRSSYSEIGIGAVYDENSVYGYHWAQLFGNPYLAPKNAEDGFSFVNYGDSQIVLEVGDNFNGEVWAESLTDVFPVVGIDAEGNPNDLILTGNSVSNVILGGSGNSSLWGGVNVSDDTLVGGSGTDMFWYGKYEGNDVVSNANSADIVNLYDASLNEIAAVDISENQVAVRFTTGTTLTINDSDRFTPLFQLADGTHCRYNRDVGQWQDS